MSKNIFSLLLAEWAGFIQNSIVFLGFNSHFLLQLITRRRPLLVPRNMREILVNHLCSPMADYTWYKFLTICEKQ